VAALGEAERDEFLLAAQAADSLGPAERSPPFEPQRAERESGAPALARSVWEEWGRTSGQESAQALRREQAPLGSTAERLPELPRAPLGPAAPVERALAAESARAP
jgi:hypothetical protein